MPSNAMPFRNTYFGNSAKEEIDLDVFVDRFPKAEQPSPPRRRGSKRSGCDSQTDSASSHGKSGKKAPRVKRQRSHDEEPTTPIRRTKFHHPKEPESEKKEPRYSDEESGEYDRRYFKDGPHSG